MNIQDIGRQFGAILESLELDLFYKELFKHTLAGASTTDTGVILACIPYSAFSVSVVFSLLDQGDNPTLVYSLHTLCQYKEKWQMVCPIAPPEGWVDRLGNGLSVWYDNDTRHDSTTREYRQFLGPEINQPLEDEVAFSGKVLRHLLTQIEEPLADQFDDDTVPFVIPGHSDMVSAIESTKDQVLCSTYVMTRTFWERARIIIGTQLSGDVRKSFPFKLIG